jgi:rubrerythrin
MRLTDLHHDLDLLRGDVAAELEAVTRLESQTSTLHDEDAREEVRRIADEKKAHVAALLRQIERLDPKFSERLRG